MRITLTYAHTRFLSPAMREKLEQFWDGLSDLAKLAILATLSAGKDYENQAILEAMLADAGFQKKFEAKIEKGHREAWNQMEQENKAQDE